MPRKNRTTVPPLMGGVPHGNPWTWYVSYHVARSGYPDEVTVQAIRIVDDESISGSAKCACPPFADLHEVVEFLAVEAMLVACEPQLPGLGAAVKLCEFRT